MGIFRKKMQATVITMEILDRISHLQLELEDSCTNNTKELKTAGPQQLILLLSGISSCRKIPGIASHMGYEKLYLCPERSEINQVKSHLKRLYHIVDRESLMETCYRMYSNGEEYNQFLSFWNGDPIFDVEELTGDGRRAFEACREYAENFREIVEKKGFYAWDVNERIGLCRAACACGLIDSQDFFQICTPWARQTFSLYRSWVEYAISCLCGSVYFMFVQEGMSDEKLEEFYSINENLVRRLFYEDGEWSDYSWPDGELPRRQPAEQDPVETDILEYEETTEETAASEELKVEVEKEFSENSDLSDSPVEKAWAIPSDDLRHLLKDWEGPSGCLATDRILVDGSRVGYMYREQGNGNFPDSGWRFFAGDESSDYTSDPSHIGIYHLNTICNYDPGILPYLASPAGTAFYRGKDGSFIREEAPGEE